MTRKLGSFIKYGIPGVLLVIAGILVWLVLTLDINQYKPLLVAAVNKETGREVQIAGDLKFSPSLIPTISVQAITLANAPWSETGLPLVTVGKVEARVALMPLLSGKFQILDFTLADVKLSLETDAGGQGNWVFASDTANASESVSGQIPAGLPPITVEQITLQNVELNYTANQQAPQLVKLHKLTGALKDLDSPLDIQMQAAWQDYTLELAGSIGSLNNLMEDANYPVNLEGKLAGILDLTVNGTVTRPLSLERIDADVSFVATSLADFNPVTGQHLPALGPLSVSGKLAYTGSEVSLDSMSLKLDKTVVNGRAGYTLSDVPQISLDLKSDLIDLQQPESQDEQPTRTRLFPDTPLPMAALAGMNLDARVQIGQFKSNSALLSNLQAQIRQGEKAIEANVSTGLAGGQLTGDIGINLASASPALRIKLNGTDIQLEQMAHDVNKPWFTGGPMQLQLDGTSYGVSAADFAANYTGKLLIKVGEATMPNANVDLFGADVLMSVFNRVNPLAGQEKTSLLECAVINLNVVNGIAAIDRQIAMQTSKMVMTGSGEINLGSEQLNLGIRPYAREGIGISLGDMAGFVRIGGTLLAPKAEVDTQGAVKTGIAAGAAVATGGLSLLAQGLYNKNTRDPAPCETALQDKPSASAPPQPANETGSGSKPGIINNVKSGLKKLFGK